MSRFQSTPPRGGRPGPGPGGKSPTWFQSTPPRGGRLMQPTEISQNSRKFQSTPPRGGRRDGPARARDGAPVSIHAPARGATAHEKSQASWWIVSIHAPARGATRGPMGLRMVTACFNPRPRAGGDAGTYGAPHGHRLFQSTPPRGGRPRGPPGRSDARGGFNPRPRAGGDDGPRGAEHGLSGVSIHAPARGATQWRRRLERLVLVSIHAPARGATRAGAQL